MGTNHITPSGQSFLTTKDKTDKKNMFGVICDITFPDCQQTYVVGTSRALEARLKEHAVNRDHSLPLEHIE